MVGEADDVEDGVSGVVVMEMIWAAVDMSSPT